jgi:23S rRNA (cytosine1962-C5)-methyltransferase
MLRVTDLASFQNRLAKNRRNLQRWAQRNAIEAYRLYDRDVPEFPLIADWYGTDAGPRLYLQEVDTGWRQTQSEHAEWFGFVREACAEVLEIDAASIICKLRVRQRVRGDRSQQYERAPGPSEERIVCEGGHRFHVNLGAYLDTGLFLDHRITRALVGAGARGKRFLNLFAYTGSFTVYAAGAGASESISVDLSNTYCAWAERNLALNGAALERHAVVRADVLTWLAAALRARERFDLIVLDPPSFSNSKKMHDVLDVQQDHARLIDQCLHLLRPGGELYFSTNLRSFELDPALAARAGCSDITRKTLPEDFRDPRIHQAWHFTS